MNKNKKMPKKLKPLPPKAPEDDKEISTPISSEPFSQKPNSNKPTSRPNQTHKPHTASSSSSEEGEEGEEGEEEEEEISTPISSQPFSQKPNTTKPISHPNQTHKPHTASSSSSSSEEEEEVEEEGEEGEEEIDREEDDEETEDSETEKTKYISTLSKPTQPTKQKDPQEEKDSDYEQDSVSGSNSESSSQSPKSNKPISSKKIYRHPKSKKPQTSSDGAAPSCKHPQAAGEANENGSKKQAPGACHEGEKAGVESKQPAFFWSPEDEITLLKGMMEFAERGYSDASSDKDGFLRFINKLLTIKVTRRQLVGKIKHLKYKYRIELKKVREGVKPVFSNPHHKLKYQLSKKLWGENDPTLEDDGDDDDDIEVENGNGVDTLNTVEKGGGNAKKRMSRAEEKCGGNVKKRMSRAEEKCGGNVKRILKNSQNDDVLLEEVDSEAVLYPHLNELLRWSGIARVSGLSESDVKRAFQLMSPSRVKELDLQWRKLQLKERDIHMERLSLSHDLTKQFYDLVKSSEV